MEKEKQSTRAAFLVRLKVALTIFVGVLWMLNLAIDEAMMADITGTSPPDLNYLGAKGVAFALIGAVGAFVALVPSKPWLWPDRAAKAATALATVSSGYYLLLDSTGGNIGSRYITVVAATAAIIVVGLLVGPALYGVAQACGALLWRLGWLTGLDRLGMDRLDLGRLDPIKWAVTRAQAFQRGPQ